MKKLMFLGMIAAMLISCKSKDEVNVLVGNYTYKTSGVVTINNSPIVSGDVHLTPETGTMQLSDTNKENEVVLSFNQSLGDAYDIAAFVTSDSIYLRPMRRNIDVEVARDTLLSGNVIKHLETFDVEVSGSGHMLNNGDLCFMVSYKGVQRNDAKCVLNGTNIHVHCKRNAN